jgi:hypothetical protein
MVHISIRVIFFVPLCGLNVVSESKSKGELHLVNLEIDTRMVKKALQASKEMVDEGKEGAIN